MAVKEYVISFQVGDTVLESRIYQAGDVFGDLPSEKGVYHWYLGNGEEILPTTKVPSKNTTVWGSTFALRITQPIALNVSTDSIVPILHMVQGDSNSRTITATLWDGASPFAPSGTAMLRFRKPDGTGGLYDKSEGGESITTFGNGVSIPVAAQMLAVAGTVYCELDFYAGSSGVKASRLATFRFLVDVEASAYPDAQIISSDYYNVLASDIADAKTAAANAQKSAAAAAKSAASAATSVEGAVKYNVSQALTPVQRVQAQQNIGVTWACNPNLLRNWYFPWPVNQRDVSGTISTAGYFLDGWKLVSGAVTIGTDGITLNGTMTQVLEHAPAGTVTASVLTPEGVGKVVPVYDSTAKTFTITAAGKKLLAAKLELGSVQTLAHQDSSGAWVLNEIPDYAEQLRKCQRYLYVQSGTMITFGVITGGKKTLNLAVPVPVPMRSKPTLVGVPDVTNVRTIQGTNMAAEITGGGVVSSTSLDTTIAISVTTETFNTDDYVNNTPIVCYISGVELNAEL